MNTIRTTARIASIFAAAALVAGASAPAFAAREEGKPAPTETPAPKVQRYCVASEVSTGTILRSPKVCKTRAQWIADTGVDPVRAIRK